MMRNVRTWLVAGSLLAVPSTGAADVGTAFSYQGFLEYPVGTPVSDTCTVEFMLCDDATAACSPGTISDHPGVAVTDGVFTVADVDFGANGIDGTARWLEIKVQCSGDASPITLTPRQELTPAPYSIRAGEGVGGPNALHVTPSGNVGIGTTTPVAQLDVNGAARTTTLDITGGSPIVPAVVGWGNNQSGQLNVPFDVGVVSGGDNFSLGMHSDGTLVGWGSDNDGRLIVPSGTFIAVDAGESHGLAIRDDSTLAGWGGNNFGQTNVPVGTFTAVSAGDHHSLAIRSDGTLAGWGDNSTGATNIPAGTFIAVSAGGGHSQAIRSDGTLVGWGNSQYGQLNVPSGTFIAVAAGGEFSVAIRSNGTLAGWGYNLHGQTDVPSGTFIAVSAGRAHALAIRSDGTLVGWGLNDSGQTDVPPGTFSTVSAGHYFGLAMRDNAPAPNPALRLHTDSAFKPGSNTWTIYSDRRLKKNIEPLVGALDRLLQLRGVTFRWIDPASQGGSTGPQMGLIADEVQRAFPQWVGHDPRGYQTLTVGGFEALTAEALRELKREKDAQIEILKGENIELRARLQQLEVKLAHLAGQKTGGSR